jgi:hypothetical protein
MEQKKIHILNIQTNNEDFVKDIVALAEKYKKENQTKLVMEKHDSPEVTIIGGPENLPPAIKNIIAHITGKDKLPGPAEEDFKENYAQDKKEFLATHPDVREGADKRVFKVTKKALKNNPLLEMLFIMEGDHEKMTLSCPAANSCDGFLQPQCELFGLEEIK